MSEDWLAVVLILSEHLLLGLDLERLECLGVRGRQLHGMRVDDFGFLLEVKCLTVLKHYGTLQLVFEVLLVARAERFGVRIAHKLVGHASLAAASIASDSRVVHHECALRVSHGCRVASLTARSTRRKK